MLLYSSLLILMSTIWFPVVHGQAGINPNLIPPGAPGNLWNILRANQMLGTRTRTMNPATLVQEVQDLSTSRSSQKLDWRSGHAGDTTYFAGEWETPGFYHYRMAVHSDDGVSKYQELSLNTATQEARREELTYCIVYYFLACSN